MNSYFLFPSSALSPPGLFSPGSGEKDTMCVCACILSRFSCVRLFVTPWTIAHQAPLSMGILQARILSGLPCPPPGDLPHPGIKPTSLMSPAWADGFFTTSATWEPQKVPQNTPTLQKSYRLFRLTFPQELPLPCSLLSHFHMFHPLITLGPLGLARLPVSAYAVPAWDGLFPFPHQRAPSPLRAKLTGHPPQSVPTSAGEPRVPL